MGGLLLVSFTGCDSQGAAPAPPAKLGDKDEEGSASSLKNGSGKKSSSKNEAEEEEEEEEEDEKDDKKTSKSSGSSGKFDTGGAEISDDDTKEAVEKCHKNGKVYDRFADDGAGSCGSLLLAKMNCTESGIKKVLTDRQIKQFEESLGGSYAGWMIDQCGDCPPGSSDKLCESSTGAKQTGTKVFFVKEDGDEIRGKAMVLPTRPGQDEDDEEESEEED